ncbi:MAG: hypothetical protein V1728_04595 [Candidatus Micrarchaeota archaeon]
MAQPVILTGGKTNLKVVERYDNGGLMLAQLNKKYGNTLAPFKDIMEYFTNDKLFQENKKILYAASPIASGTMMAFSKEKPLCDLADENGIIVVEGTYNGITGRFGGFTVDQARKAGFVVDKPGALLVAQKGYSINEDGCFDYTINFTVQSPEHLKEIMRVFFSPDGEYKNGQLRQVESEFNLPLGKLSSSGPDGKNLYLYIRRPGSAVPGYIDFRDYGRFGANLGGGVIDGGRFGGVMPENTGAQAPAAKILAPTPAQFEAALQEAKELGVSESALDVILAYATKQ